MALDILNPQDEGADNNRDLAEEEEDDNLDEDDDFEDEDDDIDEDDLLDEDDE